jgi:hypothetical protein
VDPDFRSRAATFRSTAKIFGLLGLLEGADTTGGATASGLFAALLLALFVGLVTSFGEETPFSHTGLRTRNFP